MTTAAEQYRKLVAKLESINPSEPVNEAPVAAFGQTVDAPPADAATAPLAGSVAVDPAPAPEVNPAPAPTGEIPTLPGTFKQAYAQAVKQGLAQFKWCGTYSTRRGQAPNPKPAPTPAPAKDPMTFAKAYSLRNAPNAPVLKPTDITQAGPNSTILRPGGGVDPAKLFSK